VRELTIEQMAATFADGERVYLAGSSGECTDLSDLLAQLDCKVADAHFITSFVPGINSRCLARPGHASRTSTFFMQPSLRAAHAEGRVDFRPLSYFGIHRFLTDPATTIDTAVVQVAPPDPRDQCSLGPAVEFMPSVLARASRVFGVINPNVPRLPGSPSVPMERFAAISHCGAPLATYEVGKPSPAAGALVEHLATLIPSGSALQVGLGKVPSQLLRALGARRNLTLHSGMISDAALDLADCGALCAEPAIRTGVAIGSAAFYARLAAQPGLSFAEVGFTHSPQTLSRISGLRAVNSALQVDLLGQVNAEMLDGQYVSGPGGLPDFARGAHLDPEGLSIIALNATDGSGRLSRIVPRLGADAVISVPQYDVDAVVTEYGVALLRGQSLDERARRLCAIAHPDHRAELNKAS
jgi:acyl-CoA hydrolase